MTKNDLIKKLIDIDGNPDVQIGYEYDGIQMIESDISTVWTEYTEGGSGVSIANKIIIGDKYYVQNLY